MLKTIFLATVVTLSVTACNQSIGQKSETYAYDYSVNGCDTKHSFKSKGELCNALRDDALNGGCARVERLERYKKVCDPSGF